MPKMARKIETTGKSVQMAVKDSLELIVLAMALRQPICGTDIIKTIHSEFGVLLSPGTIYPLLHELEDRGLLKCELGVKKKTYRPVEASKDKIQGMLEDQVKAWELLGRFFKPPHGTDKS
jgi:DNA-binding PadR family transcriptional regulator